MAGIKTDYLISSINLSTQSSKSNVENKYSESNLDVDRTNSSKVIESNDDFKKVLNSKTSLKDQGSEKLAEKTQENKSLSNVDDNEIDEINDKIKKLEEDSKSDSKDNVNEILQSLLNLLKKLDVKEENGEKNSELLKSIVLNGVNGSESSNKQSTILNQLLELLKSHSLQKKLDSNSSGVIEKILNQLGIKSKDNKEVSNGIKDLISEISNVIKNKDNQGEKVLTLKDMLSKSYSQNKQNSLENGSNNTVKTQDIKGQGIETIRGLTINKDNFANDLINDIKYMSNNGLKELTVKINPRNLGEITINLSQEDGIIKADLKLNSKEIEDLISQSLAEIKGKLTEQSSKISDVNIEFYQDDITFFKEDGNNRNGISELNLFSNKAQENKSSSDINEIDELKDELKKLEEDSKSDSKDDVNGVLQSLLNLLNKLGVKEEKGEANSSELLKSTMLNRINENESSDKQSTTLNQLLELLKSDSVQKKLDSDSLGLMEKVLNQLGIKSGNNKELSNGIKDLMSEISNVMNNKADKGEKISNFKDMLNNGYSQNKDSSLESRSNNNAKAEKSKESKEVTKEDKFLSSLIDDKKDSSLDKINLFASRTQAVQVRGTETTRGLTINRATFTNDFIKDVKFMSNNGLKELSVKVNPGNLGEITINLIQEDGAMKANLKANSKETVALLSQNLAEIKEKLAEQNIKVSNVNIELYQDDTTFFKEQGFGSQLSQDQGKNRNNGNSNSVIRNGATVEEEVIENINNDYNNNLDFLA